MRTHAASRDKFIRLDDDPERRVIRTWEDLYDFWLLPTLLAQPPLRLYPKPLVSFARSILTEPANDIDWWSNRRDIGVRTVLGDVLKDTSTTQQTRQFSAVALEFAAHKFEAALHHGPVAEDQTCCELIAFLDLRPTYLRRVQRGSKTYLRGTTRFCRETGMRLWLRVK